MFSKVKYEVRSPKLIWAPVYVQLYSLAETPQLPPSPPLGSYTRALLVSQKRQHLFVTPWMFPIEFKLCIIDESEFRIRYSTAKNLF
jgi:hypothetical protein